MVNNLDTDSEGASCRTSYHDAESLPYSSDAQFEPTTNRMDNDVLTENDTVIMLMGPTGSGKSSCAEFVRVATGNDSVEVGHGFITVTNEIHAYRVRAPSSRVDEDIVLVDTPAFDHTFKPEADILRDIVNFLEIMSSRNVRLRGILYLHPISMGRSSRSDPAMLRKIFQPHYRQITLVTTLWDELSRMEIGVQREKELIRAAWKEMIDQGTRTIRYQNDYSSAWRVIRFLLEDREAFKIKLDRLYQIIFELEGGDLSELRSRMKGRVDHFQKRIKVTTRKSDSLALTGPRKFFRALKRKLFHPGL